MDVRGIQRLPQTNEWRVFCRVDGKDNEDRAYYTDDPEDAVNTMILEIAHAKERRGEDNSINPDKYTQSLLAKYRPDYVQSPVQTETFAARGVQVQVMSRRIKPQTQGLAQIKEARWPEEK